MNKMAQIIYLTFTLSTSAFAQDYERGLIAVKGNDYKSAILNFEPLAEKGHAKAQVQLGHLYYYEHKGASGSGRLAAKWYTKAAVQGNADAQFYLAKLYESGTGLPQDKTEASIWWRRAAEQGHVLAQISIAQWCIDPLGTQEDYEEGAEWYRKAAVQGSAKAQFQLAELYQRGKGVAKNNSMAHMWYNIANATGESSDLRRVSAKERDRIAEKMTETELVTVQRMATKCMLGGYNDCGLWNLGVIAQRAQQVRITSE